MRTYATPFGIINLGPPKHTYPTDRDVSAKTLAFLKDHDMIIGVRCHKCDALWHNFPRKKCPKGCKE